MDLLLSLFRTLVKTRTGLMLEDENSITKLRVAVNEAMTELKMTSLEQYFVYISNHADEFQSLVNALTINETYFFRESEHLTLLVDTLVPQFRQHQPFRPLRILSAGCSSGEEPYSIVMALVEKFGDAVMQNIEVVAGDIDSQVLKKAQQARYYEFSFRGVSVERRHRFFTRSGDAYHLKDAIRQRVRFCELNLFSPAHFRDLAAFDVIFFRNVSIYFDADARKIIQHNLVKRLTSDGVLIIGTAETLANDFGILTLVESQGVFYFTQAEAAQMTSSLPSFQIGQRSTSPIVQSVNIPITPQPQPHLQPTSPLVIPTLHPESTQLPPHVASQTASLTQEIQNLVQLIREKQYELALVMVEDLLLFGKHQHPLRLLKAFVLLNRKQFVLADQLLQQSLAEDSWCLDSLILLGLSAKWQHRLEDALSWFKRAVYAHSGCWIAHYYLADAYRHIMDHSGTLHLTEANLALREFRVCLQLLAKEDTHHGLMHVPLDISLSEIRFLCEHHSQKLSTRLQELGHGN